MSVNFEPKSIINFGQNSASKNQIELTLNNENELKKYLMFSEGAASGNINVAKNNAHEKQKLLKNLKQSLSLQQSVENVANWAKLEYRLHLIEVIVVGIVIGVAAIVVPIFWGKWKCQT